MGSVVAFKPRPRDRDTRVTLPPMQGITTFQLDACTLTALDNLLHSSPWSPGQPRPKGSLVVDLQGSGLQFVLKIVTQSDVSAKATVSYQIAKNGEFPNCYCNWVIKEKIPEPSGYMEFALLNQELQNRRWMPANHYEPTSGLGVIFGYRRDVHNILIVQVEYNPSYPTSK